MSGWNVRKEKRRMNKRRRVAVGVASAMGLKQNKNIGESGTGGVQKRETMYTRNMRGQIGGSF
jgi:hypothetical protein